MFSSLLYTFTLQTTHIPPLQRPARPWHDPREEAGRVGTQLPASHPHLQGLNFLTKFLLTSRLFSHLQGKAAETRAVHVEAEEVQGRAGFRGHGVSTGQPSAVGRWIGRSASRVSSASSASSTSSACSATGSSASRDAAKHSCCNLWNVLTAHWPVGQFGDQYFKILLRQNLKVLEKKGPISNLCNNHWIQSDRRCRKKWVNRIGGQGFPILQTEQLLPSPQSNSEKEGGDRGIDFSKRSQNWHCSERRWNPIRKGILLTTKSQNWRINKIVRLALFCWWNIGDNFSHFHLAVMSQHILFDVALLRCSNVTVQDPEGYKWQFFLYFDVHWTLSSIQRKGLWNCQHIVRQS